MPAKNILLSVQESMFDDMVHVAHDLTLLGYNLYATELTQEYLSDKGVKATLLTFPGDKVCCLFSLRRCLVVFDDGSGIGEGGLS